MGHISKERYEQKKVDRLLNHLKVYSEKGHPIDFEIFVDGFKVVRRTSDVEMFSMYEEFVDGDTKTVEFIFYTGSSNNNHKHIFFFGEAPREFQREDLGGLDVNDRIQDGIQNALKEKKYETIELENKQLRDEVRDLEKEVETLEKEKSLLEAKQSPLNSFLGDIGSSLVESFIRKNPKLMSAIPGGETLAGLIHTESDEQTSIDDSEVSFQSKATGELTALNEEEKASIAFVNQLKRWFSKDEFDQVATILQALSENKERITEIIEKLTPNEE